MRWTQAGQEKSYLPDLNINEGRNWKVPSSMSPMFLLQVRKPGSERLSNLPSETQQAGDRMRTRTHIYHIVLSHFRMASKLLQLRNTDLDSEEKEIFKMCGKKVPRVSW